MNPKRILLPLNIRRCPLEVFPLVNSLAKAPDAVVILLHVVTLNIDMAANRIYEELARDARWYLERLARGCLGPGIAYTTRVRLGKPAAEILAEAIGKADLVVLPSYPPSFRDRIFGLLLPSVVEQVARRIRCCVFRARKQDQLNCEDVWGRSSVRGDAQTAFSDRPFRTEKRLPVSDTDALSSTPEPRRWAA